MQRKSELFRPVVDEINKSSAVVKIKLPKTMHDKGSDVPNDLVSALH